MAIKICEYCIYLGEDKDWCEYQKRATNETGSCEKWTAIEKPQIANQYAPNIWDEWKKNSEKKKGTIWEMPKR